MVLLAADSFTKCLSGCSSFNFDSIPYHSINNFHQKMAQVRFLPALAVPSCSYDAFLAVELPAAPDPCLLFVFCALSPAF